MSASRISRISRSLPRRFATSARPLAAITTSGRYERANERTTRILNDPPSSRAADESRPLTGGTNLTEEVAPREFEKQPTAGTVVSPPGGGHGGGESGALNGAQTCSTHPRMRRTVAR